MKWQQGKGEETLWSGLLHRNIVPLLRCTKFRMINVACFEMHAYPHHLRTVVQQDEFLTSSEALQQMKTCLHHVLCGLFAQKAVVPLRFEVG
ncbi:hypothetical protein AVEN_157675-1 [Araneus ventricosus]|uniref:Protein kinase domain-containing protein n=1 Tax=Araneus ventricosus TaxID=182803 RepID=A0A4Y2TSB8_ARAVE|nr:hypothetical protein AVEN_157675-1 [Araneus ventricosus]